MQIPEGHQTPPPLSALRGPGDRAQESAFQIGTTAVACYVYRVLVLLQAI